MCSMRDLLRAVGKEDNDADALKERRNRLMVV